MEGITINSNRGGTIYRDKDGNEIPDPNEVSKKQEQDFEKQDVNEDE